MFSASDAITLGILIILVLLLTTLLIYLIRKKNKKQLDNVFIIIFVLLLGLLLTSIAIIFSTQESGAYPIYIDFIGLSFLCFLPVVVLLMSLIFANTYIKFSIKYLLLFIIPILSVILVWTNDFHHLFYKELSSITSEIVYGEYFYVYYVYTYLLFAISLFILIKYSVKNSGMFSKQAVLIFIGAIIPIVINLLGYSKIVPMSIHVTPITFGFTILCFSFAILKFNLFKVTPIALQRIVDRISDSYLVLDDDNIITDFNKTFLTTFNLNEHVLRDKSIFDLIKSVPNISINLSNFKVALDEVKKTNKTKYFQLKFDSYNKYFNIEVNSILSNNNSFIGTLILFKDTTQHNIDMNTIKDNQNRLIEQERLASLGQMIGGIAHNLKTPIMSIAGAVEGISDLVREYEASVGDSDVTVEDHHEIAKDMRAWLEKIKTHTSYMSDVITAVKGQAVTFSEEQITNFSIDELLKMVSILMKHELNKYQITLNITNNVPASIPVHGNINSLVQVVNNIVANAVQASENATNRVIDLTTYYTSSDVIISIKDYGCGIPKSVQKTLFKEMITTKGKNGSGLGLFMSYSNIKAHFNGDLTFESEEGIGTTFKITLPL